MAAARHRPRLLGSMGLTLAAVLVLVAAPASALSSHDRELLGSKRSEIIPAASDTLLMWSENTHAHPRFYNAYVRPLAGGARTKLNADGTKGFAGSIDGSKVIFQQTSGNSSSMRIYDTATGHYVPVRSGVNTPHWEYAPFISGNFLFFGRVYDHHGRYADKLILHNATTGHETVLDTVSGRFNRPGPYHIVGQLNGDYVTWATCLPHHGCDVFLRRISTGHVTGVPDHGLEYSSSVAADGTLFFVRSGPGCGNHARLMEFKNGSATLVRDFAKNRDSFETYAVTSTQLVREVNSCHTHDANVDLTTIS